LARVTRREAPCSLSTEVLCPCLPDFSVGLAGLFLRFLGRAPGLSSLRGCAFDTPVEEGGKRNSPLPSPPTPPTRMAGLSCDSGWNKNRAPNCLTWKADAGVFPPPMPPRERIRSGSRTSVHFSRAISGGSKDPTQKHAFFFWLGRRANVLGRLALFFWSQSWIRKLTPPEASQEPTRLFLEQGEEAATVSGVVLQSSRALKGSIQN